jgi:ribosomal-protein-alanine N-acetyltransferase
LLLESGEIKLRTLRRTDKKQWEQLRLKNEKWLRPWEATSPDPLISLPSFRQMLAFQRREEKALRSITWAVVY